MTLEEWYCDRLDWPGGLTDGCYRLMDRTSSCCAICVASFIARLAELGGFRDLQIGIRCANYSTVKLDSTKSSPFNNASLVAYSPTKDGVGFLAVSSFFIYIG
jgi:hypothetical protein